MTDPFTVLMDAVEQAEKNDIPAGPGRAWWVLSQFRQELGPHTVLQLPARRRIRCQECGEWWDHEQHPGVTIFLPDPYRAVGPLDPRCAVRRLRGSLA